jgi:hypothetical protein
VETGTVESKGLAYLSPKGCRAYLLSQLDGGEHFHPAICSSEHFRLLDLEVSQLCTSYLLSELISLCSNPNLKQKGTPTCPATP